MIGALIYFRLCSLRNWIRRRLARLRKPKYFFGAIVGAAYVWFFFLRRTGFAGDPRSPAQVQFVPFAMVIAILLFFAVLRLIAVWLAPDKPGLGFTEAEVAFLFPAPMSRRMLINYKLVNSQFTILISAVVVSLLSQRWSALGGNTWTHLVGWWILTSTLSLHSMGAALTIARMTDRGIGKATRRTIIWGIVVLYVGALVYAAWDAAATGVMPGADSKQSPIALGQAMASSGHLRWLLFPVRVVLGPFLAANWAEFGIRIGPALGVVALHYLWVYKSEASFEEASIAQAEKLAKRIAAMQSGRLPSSPIDHKPRSAPFPLNPAGGWPEIAFLWKNLLSTREIFSLRVFLGVAALIAMFGVLMSFGSRSGLSTLRTAGAVSAVLSLYALLLGPQLARQDLRSDLANADLLKTYPLPGWRIMLGQLLAPTAILTGILWLCLLMEGFALGAGRTKPLPPGFIIAGGISVATVIPLVCLLQIMVPNAAVILFPSWAGSTRTRDRGIDVMGQRLLFVFGQSVVLLLALVPALGVGLLFGFAANWIFPGPVSIAIGAITAVALLGAEIAVGLAWLGWRFENFDLTAEPAP